MPVTLLETDDRNGVTRMPDPAIVKEGTGASAIWNGVDLGAGMLLCGQWIGQPGELTVRPRQHHEMFTVVSGLIELIEPDGSVTRIGPGQASFIPKGWSGTWRTVVKTRKTYALLKALPPETP
ncbi:MAG: cupin domain-containing protein [Pseudomonadota bacterium]